MSAVSLVVVVVGWMVGCLVESAASFFWRVFRLSMICLIIESPDLISLKDSEYFCLKK